MVKPRSTPNEALPDEEDITKVPLEDGSGSHVKIRYFHLHDVKNYFHRLLQDHEDGIEDWLSEDQVEVASKYLNEVLLPLCEAYDNLDDPHRQLRMNPLAVKFICFKRQKRCIPVHTQTSPKHSLLFIYHLILMYGKWETELDIVQQPSLREALFATRTILEETRDGCNVLLRKYITQDLKFDAISSRVLCRHIKRSSSLLYAYVLDKTVTFGDLPPILLQQIEMKYTAECTKKRQEQHSFLVQALSTVGIINFPSVEELTARRPIEWSPRSNLTRPEYMDLPWAREQMTVLERGMQKLNELIFPMSTRYVKNLVLCGPPGNNNN